MDCLWPYPILAQEVQYSIGFTIIALSFLLFGLTLKKFAKSGTSVDYRKPTTMIISTGPFAYSRNPVYVSMTMCHVGIAIAADSIWVLVMVLPAVLIIHYIVISREEAFLEGKFGEDYLRYKASVRRWI